jgi:conserved hypothetical protein
MARMVVIYRTPKNVEAFDRHYFDIHVPLAKKIPGLRKYEVSDGPIATPVGTSEFIGSERCISTTLRRSKRRLPAWRDKLPGRIADFLRRMTRAFRCSFSTTGTFEPAPPGVVPVGEEAKGGDMAGGRLYGS